MLAERNIRRQQRKVGQIVKVPLSDTAFSVAIILTEPLVSFFDKIYASDEKAINIDQLPTAFTIMVMNNAITSGRWEVIGKIEVPNRLRSAPQFCKKDEFTGNMYIYQEVPELAPHYERPAKLGECDDLETAAVWEAEHVEDRLRDHFAGVSNKWVKQLDLK